MKDTNPPTVTLCTPNGGEIWQAGTTQTITWTANDTPDATAKMTYTLYLSTNGGSTYPTTIATLPNQDQCSSCTCSYTWAVPDSVGTNCKVKVEAEDPATNTATDESDAVFEITAAACPVETASVTFQSGWNTFSLALVPTSTDINTIFADQLSNVLSVWHYSGGPSGTWSSFAPGAPSSLTTIVDGEAYWVNMATGGPFTMTYQGRKCACPPTPPPTYSYGTGWYMVGFKSTVNDTITNYLDSQCGTINARIVTPILAWNATTQAWVSKNCGDNMITDKGYWVYFNTAHTVSPGCN
jgi:hypothetical protein